MESHLEEELSVRDFEVRHKRSDHAYHYNGNKASNSCGLHISVEPHRQSVKLQGLHTKGIMTRCSLEIDLHELDELVYILNTIRKLHA